MHFFASLFRHDAVSALSDLDDSVLKDLGLSRYDLRDARRYGGTDLLMRRRAERAATGMF